LYPVDVGNGIHRTLKLLDVWCLLGH